MWEKHETKIMYIFNDKRIIGFAKAQKHDDRKIATGTHRFCEDKTHLFYDKFAKCKLPKASGNVNTALASKVKPIISKL